MYLKLEKGDGLVGEILIIKSIFYSRFERRESCENSSLLSLSFSLVG